MIEWIKAFWIKWFGTGTPDDWRNPFWRVTEAMDINILWHRYLIDLRLGFIRTYDLKPDKKEWKCYIDFWKPVEQNFWNGILTFNIYIVKGVWVWYWPVIYTIINSTLVGVPYLIWGTNWIPWLCVWTGITIPCWFFHFRYDFVFRPLHDWYFESGIGILFDRGEMAIKPCVVYHNEGSDARGWDEGSV
jgi:hypothetical protein